MGITPPFPHKRYFSRFFGSIFSGEEKGGRTAEMVRENVISECVSCMVRAGINDGGRRFQIYRVGFQEFHCG